MRKLVIVLILLHFHCTIMAQVKIAYKIDTSQVKTMKLCNFIRDYMNQDTISNKFWHPKYKTKEVFDYNIDWIWSEYSPKKLSEKLNVEIVELQQINDSLSYFKLQMATKPSKDDDAFSNVYKYYIVEKAGKYFFDNCKEYDSKKFAYYKTKNIGFYTSHFYAIEKSKMDDASKAIDSLYLSMKVQVPRKTIDYFMCANEEELNNLANIVVWNGGLGGFTNIPEGYVVGINKNPVYKHEFIHAILGYGANCFFLQEGIATLFGGSKEKSYQQGFLELNDCYKKGACNFDNLYAREVGGQFSSNLTYTFGAVFCQYLIDNYGFDFFYKLYYDKSITSENFLDKVSIATSKNKEKIKQEVEKLILRK
jgi:hypothetical protein